MATGDSIYRMYKMYNIYNSYIQVFTNLQVVNPMSQMCGVTRSFGSVFIQIIYIKICTMYKIIGIPRDGSVLGVYVQIHSAFEII